MSISEADRLEARDDSSDSDVESGSGSDDESHVEWLVATRTKRSTAGNRLSSLLQQEDENDELELLFAEGDESEDEEFDEGAADDSDVHMDSSDDDDDQGPSATADDLDGERELQQQERAKRNKKRKANDHLPKAFQKRQRFTEDDSQSSEPIAATKPKKKLDRTSWLPTLTDAPTRLSKRATTQSQREELHKQMEVREERRLRQLERMEQADAKRQANKPKQLTQEDRLAEAARIEKKNAKSLNKWEEAEKQREEEQRLKLAALHDRKMEGPVISWLSTRNMYENGRLKMVGKISIGNKPGPIPRRRKMIEEVPDATTAESSRRGSTHTDSALSVRTGSVLEARENAIVTTTPVNSLDASAKQPDHNESTSIEKPQPVPPESSNTTTQSTPADSSNRVTEGEDNESTLEAEVTKAEINNPAAAPSNGISTTTHSLHSTTERPPAEDIKDSSIDTPVVATLPVPVTDSPKSVEYSMASCIRLVNFKDITPKDKPDFQSMVLFGRDATHYAKTAKVQKTSPVMCAITGNLARYRDPITGVPYSTCKAYKALRELRRGNYVWSSLLDTYVGERIVARGVPPRFTSQAPPSAPAPSGTSASAAIVPQTSQLPAVATTNKSAVPAS